MRKLITLCSFLIYSVYCYGQTPLRSKGTLVIVATGVDGIIIAADSRGDLMAPNDSVMAYYDKAQKIYIVGNYGMAIVGIAMVGNLTLSKLISDFNKTTLPENDILSLANAFLNFTTQNTNTAEFEALKKNIFILTGYDKAIPKIMGFTFESTNDFRYKMSTKFTVTNKSADKYFIYDSAANCEKLKKMAQKAIATFATNEHQTIKIGGPITVLKISPDHSFKWLQNNFTDLAIDDNVFTLYQTGKLKLHFLSPQYKILVDSLLKSQ